LFLEYLKKTNFRGKLSNAKGKHYAAQHTREAEALDAQRIADLGILTFLAMLGIDRRAEDEQAAG
jgi:hypothetical protein